VKKIMNYRYSVSVESIDSITSYWLDPRYRLDWKCFFVLPNWLKVWWTIFGAEVNQYIRSVKRGHDILGIAPLVVKGQTASLMGSPDVCDYLDFIITPGGGSKFFGILLEHLSKQNITNLNLTSLRPESTVLTDLVEVARGHGCDVSLDQEDVAPELYLPATWDEYLLILNSKQRHEVRRKFRRLHEAASTNYRVIEDIKGVRDVMDTFFDLFGRAREDKAVFMTPKMTSFFYSMAEAMAEVNMLRLYIMELNGRPAAGAMCFDYNSKIYLYNSGYDDRFSHLGVGMLCKVISIKDSIQRGKKKYDFLKGAEAYKHRLGGKEVPLYRCKIRIT
jgi:CelD/BcsL family acetyltransferase involved in cellulose biosynthesis